VWLQAEDDLIIERARTRHFEGSNAQELEAMRSPDSVEQVYRTLCIPALRHHIETDRPQSHASLVVSSLVDGWEISQSTGGESVPGNAELRRRS
jgi:hypothetical protein